MKAEHVEPAIALLLEQMKNRLADLGSPQITRDYENIMVALDRMTEPLDFAMAIVRHLESVATTPELRAAHNAVQGPVSAFYSSISLDANLWEAVKAVAQSDEVALWPRFTFVFWRKQYRGFRRAGADLDAEGKA